MIPQSNMPAYAFLEQNPIDPAYTEKKMNTLHFPYSQEEIKALATKNEMDALVSYLQKLGSDIPWRQEAKKTVVVGDLKNPFLNDQAAIAEGEKLFDMNCESCHELRMKPNEESTDVGPPLLNMADFSDPDLFTLIHDGTGAGMPAFATLGQEKIWKIISFLKTEHKKHELEEHGAEGQK